MKKRLIPFLLSLVMVLALVPTIALAGGEDAGRHVSAVISKKTANVGDTITVTVSNKAMTVGTFTCGIEFDKAALTCTEIKTGANYGAVTVGAALIEPQLSTVALANTNGSVGFGVVRTTDKDVAAGIIMTVKFTVKTAGDVGITVYESSSKVDGSNVVNVEKIASVLVGDVNKDGRVATGDYALVLAHVKGAKPITDIDSLAAADVNKDGRVATGDYALILAHVKGTKSLW